jgi:predicted nuclease with RNAse H fold
MITVGVDLASQSNDTAIAIIEWGEERSRALRVVLGVDDEMILDEAKLADVTGIGSPFGWPDPFFEFVSQNRAGRVNEPRRAATVSGRDEIMYRTTERRVRDWLGMKLMPSTSNMLGSTVLRCAGLQTRLQEAGIAVTRGGGGRVVEVYAPASLMAWGLHEPAYKTQSASRARILEQAARRLSLDLGEYRSLCVDSDDAADALVSAMTARAVALGIWREPVDDDERTHAATEGWICVPSGTIETLLGPQPSEPVERQ